VVGSVHLVVQTKPIAVEIHAPQLRYSIVMAGRRAVHARSGQVLADELEMPRTMFGRGLGLMFRKRLEPGRGMWINPCNGIHMMFMNFPIDAVFLDSHERVKKVYRRLPRWYGIVLLEWGAHSVLELPPSSTADIDLQRGDEIVIS
ncbi:MAG TPA: DUF192 domain-containing protein, partial [Candidatus Dormibacteraeota bacterium]